MKNDILAALKAATEPMDRTAIAQLCLSGTDKQVADQLYLLKKDGAIIGDKQRGGSFLYRMPTAVEVKAAQDAPWVAPKGDLRVQSVAESQAMSSAVLSVRSEEEVDEIELASIEDATEIIRMAEEISDEPKKLPPREVIERMIAETPSYMETPRYMDVATQDGTRYIDVWPGPTLAERMAAANEMKSQPESAVSETVEEATEEPITDDEPAFRVGVYSDGTMVLEKPHGWMFELDKAQFAVLAAFARTVGWLPA